MARAKANLDWLAKAQKSLNGDPAYRKLGSTDVKLGFEIGEAAKVVTFEAFEITDVADVDAPDLRDADIVIRMSPKDWNAYLRKRKAGKGPTLLSLDLESHVIQAANPLKRLMLERFSTSLQAFIDKGAQLAA